MPAEWMVDAGIRLFVTPMFAVALLLLGRRVLDML